MSLIKKISLDALWAKLNAPERRPTPQTTIEAVIFSLRERGLGALHQPDVASRLARCDAHARAEIKTRIKKPGIEQ
jgi:hypothetical protein